MGRNEKMISKYKNINIFILFILISLVSKINAYDRKAALRYANFWYDKYNDTSYKDWLKWNWQFGSDILGGDAEYFNYEKEPGGWDCTNFASQVLRAGGIRFKNVPNQLKTVS